MSELALADFVAMRGGRRLFAPLTAGYDRGQCVALLAPNGAGKTTMVRTLVGLHQQYEGSFRIGQLGYQGHRLGLDELLTPIENLRWSGALRGLVPEDRTIRQVLDRVGVLALAQAPIGRLSQGQQRRVALARLLISGAPLWVLDEPMTALDDAGQALLNQLLNEHCQGGGIALCSTHQAIAATTDVLHLEPIL